MTAADEREQALTVPRLLPPAGSAGSAASSLLAPPPSPFLGSHPRIRELLKWGIARGRMLLVAAESGAIEAAQAVGSSSSSSSDESSGHPARGGEAQFRLFRSLLGSVDEGGHGIYTSQALPFQTADAHQWTQAITATMNASAPSSSFFASSASQLGAGAGGAGGR